MSREQWMPVVGYEGSYEVSDQGRVRSVERVDTSGRRRRSVVLKGRLREDGHLDVNLSVGGRAQNYKIHRLVMRSFGGPCPAGQEVLHADGDGTNNRRANLRYGTRAENNLDAVAHGTHAMTRRQLCPLGHRLKEPNLVPSKLARGHRNCLSCGRGRAAARHAGHPFTAADAEPYYLALMGNHNIKELAA